MNNTDRLARATKELMLREPFYGLFLITLNKIWLDKIDTAGVSKNGINMQLAINPTFWENLSPEYRVGILKHEILHIAFHHLSLRDKYKDHRLFNIAADLEINQYIDKDYLPGGNYPDKKSYEADLKIFMDEVKRKLKEGEYTKEEARKEMLKLPIRALFLDDFEELKLEPKKGTDYYYKKLQEAQQPGPDGKSQCPYLDQLMGNGDGNGDGDCNGPGGTGDPRDPHHSHKTWKEFDNLSEAEKKLVEKQIDYQLKNVAEQIKKTRGYVPGEIKDYIDGLFNEIPPKFDWKGFLRMFVGGSIKTYTKKTRRKLSRRYDGNPGLRVKQKKHVLVAIDTSGSVSNSELIEFFSEIHHMFKTGADITVIQCDSAISNIKSYKKPEDGKIQIHGRGGTSFQPVIDYYNENQRKFSCLVYFTDGEASNPDPKPKGRMLWVLSQQSNMEYVSDFPGAKIQLN